VDCVHSLRSVGSSSSSGEACIDSNWINRIAYGGRERKARGPFYGNHGWCHTQGTGYRPSDKRIVVTCQDDGDVARTLSYKSGTSSIQGYSYIKTKTPLTQYTATYLQHPSSTQIVDNFFPVAFANHSDDTGKYGSKLTMYELSSNGAISFSGYSLNVTNTGTSQNHPHIGTVGMRKYGSNYVLFTCDFNCRNIYKFRWSPSTGSWTKLGSISGSSADASTWSSAKAWDAYQSLNFAPACSGSATYLVGTKNNRTRAKLHLWKILAGAGGENASQLRVANIAYREFTSDTTYFREGVALLADPPRAHFLTFGEDFSWWDGDLDGYELWFFDGSGERQPSKNF
jgi:hypothetical protein